MAVVGMDVRSRTDYEDGRDFGSGPYELVDGVMRFEVDPSRDSVVVDLEHAPHTANGTVAFEADFRLLRPLERSSGVLLYSVANRGRSALVPFSFPTEAPATEVTDRIAPGDGFLLRRGDAVLWSGWQWDVMRRPGLVGLDAPQALGPDALPIAGPVTVAFQPFEDHPEALLSHWPLHPRPKHLLTPHRPYPAVDDAEARMTVREWPDGPANDVPHEAWRFVADEHGDLTRVALDGGFQAGMHYEVSYTTSLCPVVGCGLLAVRDAVSYWRHDDPLRVDTVVGYGVSQTGRFLREFCYLGLNTDEQGRPVFDGVIPHVAGARRGEFNHRYAQPSVQHVRGAGHLPPFADVPVSGQPGLLDAQTQNRPKIFTTNTSSEYWRSDCSLVHTDLEGTRDVDPPDDVRIYMLAGTMHSPGFPVLLSEAPLYPGVRTSNQINTVSYTPLMRALYVNLVAWIADGVEPPPNAVPRLDDGTAVPREQVLKVFVSRAATLDPALLPSNRRADGEPYPSFVSAVDDEGNEVAGISGVDVAVPLAAHTGWNPRHVSTGAEGQGVDMLGSTIPFTERRYAGRDDYLSRVREHALEMVVARHLLAGDVDTVVATAGRMWDAVMKHPSRLH